MSTVAVDPRIRARRITVARDAGRRRLRRVGLLLGVLGLALVGLAATWTPLLDVEGVAIRGTEHTSRDAVVEAAGVRPGDPLAWFDPGSAAQEVEALPWVADASVERTWSGEVAIELTERVAVAAVTGSEGWLLVDGEGRLLTRLDVAPTDRPILDGVVATGGPGTTLETGTADALAVAAVIPTSLRAEVATIRSSGDDLEIDLRAGGVILLGGPDDAGAKLSSAAAVLATVPPGCVDRLDVSLPAAPALVRVPGCS